MGPAGCEAYRENTDCMLLLGGGEQVIHLHGDALGLGASGHGFMHIPVVGKYIVQCLEGKLDPKMQRSWRWRSETAVNRDWDALQGRGGGPNKLRDFASIAEDQWTTLPPRL